MPSWITTYLHRDPHELEARSIRAGIAGADWRTLGEDFEIEPEDVDRFMEALAWSEDPLQFSQPDGRPIRVHSWSSADRVEEELAELAPQQGRVRVHLTDTCAVVALELGYSHLRTMHEVVAFEIAYWLAEHYGGVILAPDGQWYDHAEHRWEPMGDAPIQS